MEKEKSRIYQETASSIRAKLNKRPYRLGIDMGVGSIGIAVVALEPDVNGDYFPTDLIFASSRIFSPSAGASERRAQRGQRNAIRHKVNRMEKLWKILGKRGLMLPFSKDISSDPARLRFHEEEIHKDVYSLRLRGLSERLTLPELGMVLYHIAGHRGASSIRTFLDSSENEDKDLDSLRLTEKICREERLDTFIEVLFKSKQENQTNFRNKLGYSEKTPMPTRDIIEKELNKLLSVQKVFYPTVLDESYIQEIRDCILFENEKLAPESGNCPYFPNEKKLPKASIINEERRIWESINNVRLTVERQNGNRFKEQKISLSQEEKLILYDVLRSGQNISISEFKRLFPKYVSLKKIILPGNKKKKQELIGFRFKKLEDSSWFSCLSEDMKIEFLENYLNCPDDKKLRTILKEKFGLSEAEIDEAFNISIVEGYAPVGWSAMKIILEYIKEYGLSYQEAEAKANADGKLKNPIEDYVFDRLPYYGMAIPASTQAVAGKAWHTAFSEKRLRKGFIAPFINKDEEKYGKIANPVVHQALNELRKIINEIIEIFETKPKSICIEVGRGLKIGKEKRDKLTLENNAREKDNKVIFEKYCQPHKLGKKYIKIFHLFEEQKYKCPYCLETISVDDIKSNAVDVDHILPKADTGDSSLNNLVLAHKTCNETKKSKRIPYEAFGHDKLWPQIEQYLEEQLKTKAWRFNLSLEEYEDYLANNSFSHRFASDNAYIARVACKYLQCLYPKEERLKSVKTIRGGETAVLRNAWHLNGITSSLSEALCVRKEPGYESKKNRDDFRHHALDAIVIAMFTPQYSSIIESLVSRGYSKGEVFSRLPIPKFYRTSRDLSTGNQIKQFSKEIEDFIFNNTFVSLKHSTNRNGELFKESRYSILALGSDDVMLCKRVSVFDINVASIDGTSTKTLEGLLKKGFSFPPFLNEKEKQKVDNLKKINSKKFDEILSYMPTAKKYLEDANLELEASGKKANEITDKKIIGFACKNVGGIYYQVSNRKIDKVFLFPSIMSAAETQENYCLDLFYGEKGKVCAEVIRKVNALNHDYIPRYKMKGYNILERCIRSEKKDNSAEKPGHRRA